MSAIVMHNLSLEHQDYLQKVLEAEYHALRGITRSRAFASYGPDERDNLQSKEKLAFDLLMALPATPRLQAG